jgi:hydroxymethylpyrimidine/phosphomethylpyrimidine kinase
MDNRHRNPTFLTINSHDPSGGAGLVADVETAASLGCHCFSAVTALNVRDTQQHKDRQCVPAAMLIEQVRSALEDSSIHAVKIGDLGSVAQVEAVHTILEDYPDLPVVLDPVLLHGASDGDVNAAIRLLLLPRATVTVLSRDHIHALASNADSLPAATQELFEQGGDYLLITDAAASPLNAGSQLLNRLYSPKGLAKEYAWECLPDRFHGAGSTLSAAITAYLAHGFDLLEALQQAQQFTWHALSKARQLGMGCKVPDRLFWARDD